MTEKEKTDEQPKEQPKKEATVKPAAKDVVNPVPEKKAPQKKVVAKENKGDSDEVTLKSGYRVKFHPVSYNVLYGGSADIVDPEPPMQPHPDGEGRAPVPNPTEPNYLATIRKNELLRSSAIQDNLYLFGLELLDPMPKDNLWLEKLILAKHVSKEDADSAGELQKELWFKKYIIADVETLQNLLRMTDISEEGIARAGAAFKSNA